MERVGLPLSKNGSRNDSKIKEQFLKKFGADVKKMRVAAGYSQDRVYLECGLAQLSLHARGLDKDVSLYCGT